MSGGGKSDAFGDRCDAIRRLRLGPLTYLEKNLLNHEVFLSENKFRFFSPEIDFI